MNKITFCTYPDTVETKECYGLTNYNNDTIKNILNSLDQDTTFYLIDKNCPNQWLNSVQEKVKIIFNCNDLPIEQITSTCQKK